jgi:hypothetical protein
MNTTNRHEFRVNRTRALPRLQPPGSRTQTEVSFPLPSTDAQSSAGEIVFVHHEGCHGRDSLRVELSVDFDRDRPHFWEEAKTVLQECGFKWQHDEETDDVECFIPTSFHTAYAVMSAVKTYPGPGTDIEADIGRILAVLRAS